MSGRTLGDQQDIQRALGLFDRLVVAVESLVEVNQSINNALVVIAEGVNPGYYHPGDEDDDYRPPRPMMEVELPDEDVKPEFTERRQHAAERQLTKDLVKAAEFESAADLEARGLRYCETCQAWQPKEHEAHA